MRDGVSCSNSYWIRDTVEDIIAGDARRISRDDIHAYFPSVPVETVNNALVCLEHDGKIRRLYDGNIAVFEKV